MRQKARFESLQWQEKKLSFDLAAEKTSRDGLSVLIPQQNNHSTLRLVRVAIGPLTLGQLAPGEWRELETHEVNLLEEVTRPEKQGYKRKRPSKRATTRR
jgi:hypothetical protein